MIGIEFEYEQNYGSILKDLFQGIELEDYNWYISEKEIISSNKNKKISSKLSPQKFKTLINDSDYCIISINIQAFPKESNRIQLSTYHDFKKSNCEIVFMISDANYVEIYGKEQKIMNKFKKNAQEIGCLNIEYKTETNDSRTRFKLN